MRKDWIDWNKIKKGKDQEEEKKKDGNLFTKVFNRRDKDPSNKNDFVELTKEETDKVLPKMDQIDQLLKKDCIFCGTLLIDMVDNDIVNPQ